MSGFEDDPLYSLQRQVERLFHNLVYHRHPTSHFAEPTWAPPADLVVSDQSARVILELAGVPRESVKVRLQGRTLEISGRRNPPVDPQGAHYHRAEIFFGDFRRTIDLPWDADESKIEARYHDGMLAITLQRSPAPERTNVAIESHQSG